VVKELGWLLAWMDWNLPEAKSPEKPRTLPRRDQGVASSERRREVLLFFLWLATRAEER
jgi:hypothetical protein